MSEPIITGVFTILGAILGGIISYLGSRNERKIELLKSRVNLLSKQVISYWNLESFIQMKSAGYFQGLQEQFFRNIVTKLKAWI